MSTICIVDCDVTYVIVTSHTVDWVLLSLVHMVYFCKQINMKKWVKLAWDYAF